MNTTENQNDPYAHLKQAWEDGRRIRYYRDDGSSTPWLKEGGGTSLAFNKPPECYEIEPIPADKWAAEKAAHARGKRIEYSTPAHEFKQWFYCPFPLWNTDGTIAYRIASDPAPAGKLTDEQLGEIGKAAAKCTVYWSQINTAFARAVREAVEKERAEEIARLTAEFAELEAKYSDMCTRLLECVQTHKLGLGGEKIDKLVVEAVANLTAENIALSAGFRALKADREGLSKSIVSEQTKKHEVLAGLATANAELERLRWRSVEVPVTETDGPFFEVFCKDGDALRYRYVDNFEFPRIATHWRPFCPPPAEGAEEVERERFEIWAATSSFGHDLTRMPCGKYYNSVLTSEAWELWQAARAAKEGEK